MPRCYLAICPLWFKCAKTSEEANHISKYLLDVKTNGRVEFLKILGV